MSEPNGKRGGATAAAERENTRDRLIAAAFDVVAREGLEGASVKTIAAQAGVAPGLLHYHFSTRDAVLEAALRRGLDAYLEASRRRREATAPGRQISALFASARASATADRNFFRVRLAFAAKALTDPRLAEILRDLNHAAMEETARTLAAARGSARVAAKDRVLAATLKAAFDGVMLAHLTDPAFPIAAAGEALEKMTGDALGQ